MTAPNPANIAQQVEIRVQTRLDRIGQVDWDACAVHSTGRPEDRRRHEGPRHAERERHGTGAQPMLPREAHVARRRRLRLWCQTPAQPVVHRRTAAHGTCTIRIFACQKPRGEGGIGEQTHILVVRKLREIQLMRPVKQRILVLDRGHPGQSCRLRRLEKLHGAPGGLI